jgi:anthranilate phosphoribosyltransferase
MAKAFAWGPVLTKLLAGESLEAGEARAAMAEIMEGAATPAQIAGFVVALRFKGATAEEITGLVESMRAYSQKVEVSADVLDTCGTGGDKSGTFNVSTAAALVCAGAGVSVAKHGNRAATSRCGSADVLEALGVKIDLDPAGVANCITEVGIGFCFAPVFHPAMRHAGMPRKELGIPTIFNFLGPLTNPAGAKRQALGVSDPAMLERMVEVLRRLGSSHVVAFHGHGGLDELALSGPSRVVELKDGNVVESEVNPAELDLEAAGPQDLAGGTAEENARAIRQVLEGERGPRRDIVLLNAAAGLVASALAPDMREGIVLAAQSVDSGAAAQTLDRFAEVSNSV